MSNDEPQYDYSAEYAASKEPLFRDPEQQARFDAIQAKYSDNSLSVEKAQYYQSLIDASNDLHLQREQERDVFSTAMENYRAEIGGTSTIHDANKQEISFHVESEPADGKDFEAAKLANELGLEVEFVKQMEYQDSAQALGDLAQGVTAIVEQVSDDDLRAAITQLDNNARAELLTVYRQTMAAIEKWASPHFGREVDGRTPVQTQRAADVARLVVKQIVGAAKLGGTVPTMDVLLKRARVAHGDPDFRPGKRGHQAPRVSTAGRFRNIHEACAHNRFD